MAQPGDLAVPVSAYEGGLEESAAEDVRATFGRRLVALAGEVGDWFLGDWRVECEIEEAEWYFYGNII